MNQLDLTLAIIKPHAVRNPHVLHAIRKRILGAQFKIVESKRHCITEAEAERFYDEHRQKFFFNRLVTFMCSNPSDLYILARRNAIVEWRRLMGPTKVYKAQYEQSDTIRGAYGLSDTRNAAHGSDSRQSAEREINIFFPAFDIRKWYDCDEIAFREGKVRFVADLFVHKMVETRLGPSARGSQ